jgi:NF-kappa-B inhibitor-like protein 1
VAALGGAGDGADDVDDEADDRWADRLWQDMQEHRRQAAAAAAAAMAAAAGKRGGGVAFGSGPSRDDAARERLRRAAAAAEESARILREERAKDADWRAAMMQQVEAAALPLRRTTYDEQWQRFEAWPAGKPIRFQDVPWPCATPATHAAAAKALQQQQQQQQQQALQLDAGQLRALVLAGASSAADVKLALRRELMRWHPDKFTARYGSRLAPADKGAIEAGVHAVAQHLTALKQQ